MSNISEIPFSPDNNPDLLKIGNDRLFSFHVGSLLLVVIGILAGIQTIFSPIDPFFVPNWVCGILAVLALIFGSDFIDGVDYTIIDRKKMLMTRRRGRLEDAEIISIKTASKVLLKVETRVVGGGEYDDVYTLYSVTMKIGQLADFYETTHYETARKVAKILARFLELPILDLTLDPKGILTHPEDFDSSIIDRFNKGEAFCIPDPPNDLKAKIFTNNHQVHSAIPPLGITSEVRKRLLALGVIMIVSMACIVSYDLHHYIHITDRYVIYAVGILLGVGLPVAIAVRLIRLARSIPIQLQVGPDGITLEQQRFFAKEISFINARDILYLHAYTPSKLERYTYKANPFDTRPCANGVNKVDTPPRIVVVSDNLTIEFGHGLSKEELEYIASLSVQAIISAPVSE